MDQRQKAAKILENAIALRDKGDAAGALKLIDDGIQRLRSFGNPPKPRRLSFLRLPSADHRSGRCYVSVRKRATYSSSVPADAFRQHWTAGEAMPAPSFIKRRRLWKGAESR